MSISKEQAKALQERVEANKHVVTGNMDRFANDVLGVATIDRFPYGSDHHFVIIDIDPIGAPRQSRRDTWKPSPAVQRYRAWKDKFVPACLSAGWTLGPELRVEFEIAMPASWSKKKKAQHLGEPHRQKPDIDNLVKATCDAFGEDDAHVHTLMAKKRWAEKGRIILYR